VIGRDGDIKQHRLALKLDHRCGRAAAQTLDRLKRRQADMISLGERQHALHDDGATGCPAWHAARGLRRADAC